MIELMSFNLLSKSTHSTLTHRFTIRAELTQFRSEMDSHDIKTVVYELALIKIRTVLSNFVTNVYHQSQLHYNQK